MKKRAHQSSFATVKEAAMSEPSVFRVASEVVWVMLIGSRIALPHLPVANKIRHIAGCDAQPERIPGDHCAVE